MGVEERAGPAEARRQAPTRIRFEASLGGGSPVSPLSFSPPYLGVVLASQELPRVRSETGRGAVQGQLSTLSLDHHAPPVIPHQTAPLGPRLPKPVWPGAELVGPPGGTAALRSHRPDRFDACFLRGILSTLRAEVVSHQRLNSVRPAQCQARSRRAVSE